MNFGHSTEMDLHGILRRIDERQKALGLSDNRVAVLAKKPDVVRNLRRAIDAGRKGVSTRSISAIAGALGVTSAWLMGDEKAAVVERAVAGDLDTLRTRRLSVLNELQHLDYSISLLEQSYKAAKPRKKAKSR